MHPSYLLEIYDAEGYQGPNPVRVTGKGIVRGPENTEYFVLESAEKILADHEEIHRFAVRAHYRSDSINKLTDNTCTVGIALMPNHAKYFDMTKAYGFDDFIFWKVGKIQPKNGS